MVLKNCWSVRTEVQSLEYLWGTHRSNIYILLFFFFFLQIYLESQIHVWRSAREHGANTSENASGSGRVVDRQSREGWLPGRKGRFRLFATVETEGTSLR